MRRQHHGIDIFLSALHSRDSSGIGEYFDLIPVIKFCKTIGFDIIQLLPLNDSGFDPSPYNVLSSIGLNPINLSLHRLPYVENHPLLEKLTSIKRIFPSAKSRLSRCPRREVQMATRIF